MASSNNKILSTPAMEHDSPICFQNVADFALSGDYTDRRLFIDAANPERFLTSSKAKELIKSLAGSFESGTTVQVHLKNDILYPILVLAILASGCIWTGTNNAYKSAEIRHHIASSNAKYIIVAKEDLDTVREAIADLDAPDEADKPQIILFSDLASKNDRLSVDSEVHSHQAPSVNTSNNASELHYPILHNLLKPKSRIDFSSLMSHGCIRSTAILAQTSGTTGLPKLAVRSHENLISEALAIEDNHRAKPYEVRRLFCTPLIHGFAFPEVMVNTIRLGTPAYIMDRYNETFAENIRRFGITETLIAPKIMHHLVNQTERHELIQSLRLVGFGGAPLAPELRVQFVAIFTQVAPRVVPVYGMTEAGWFTFTKYPQEPMIGSSGKPVPGCSIKLDPESLRETPEGHISGELLVHDRQLMSGYFNKPQATQDAFKDGWLRTGDIGYFKNAEVFLIDRCKDVIKVSGFQVSPTELENVLMQSGLVADAGVFGMGQDNDERPLACVVRGPTSATSGDLKAYLRSRLAGYKVSKCEVKFVDEIPRSVAGKIQRNELRKLYGDTPA